MVTPFLSFLAIAYTLARKSTLDTVNIYLKNNCELLSMMANQHQMVLAFYFYKIYKGDVDGSNNSSQVGIDSELRDIKSQPRLKCCKQEVLEGYIEFEQELLPRKQKTISTSKDLVSQLKKSDWILQQPLNPIPPKKKNFKSKISLATKPFSPPRQVKTSKKI